MSTFNIPFLTLLLVNTFIHSMVAAKEPKEEFDSKWGIANAFHRVDSTMPVREISKEVIFNSAYFDGDAYLTKLFKSTKPSKAAIGFTKSGLQIDAYFFPGKSEKRAMVIGGVHGSELASIEIANELIHSLQKGKAPEYSVIVIPCLFPDNAQNAISHPELIGTVYNIGRYTGNSGIDPNRQMPSLGKPFIEEHAKDHLGREIEKENQLLLKLISTYKPERIVNIHAIRNKTNAGVYADPRTDSKGIALGFEADSLLAIKMAKYIHHGGGLVPGNRINTQPSARYTKDPVIVPANVIQPRSICGSSLIGNKGCGVSLGSWASTAVHDAEHIELSRDAITLITMEYPGYKRSVDYTNEVEKAENKKQINLFAKSIERVFLNRKYQVQ